MPIDYKKYPKNWLTEIRPAVLNRAENKCEWCGLENGQEVYRAKIKKRIEWFPTKKEIQNLPLIPQLIDFWLSYKPVKVVLTIAHLDHDETNHDVKLNRLAALCQLCHLRYDAKEKYRRVHAHLSFQSQSDKKQDNPSESA